jgi:hypothetical protein
MVNPGHSSRGCWTCRIKKVKCDEAYPICSKCVKAKRVCLGYTPPKQSRPQSEVQVRMRGDAFHTSITYRPHVEHSALKRFTSSMSTKGATNAGGVEFLGRMPMQWSTDQVATLTMEVITEGFQSLQSPSQSVQSRTAIHRKYGLALHQLRKALLLRENVQVLFVPVLLFSFYEVKNQFLSAWRNRLC